MSDLSSGAGGDGGSSGGDGGGGASGATETAPTASTEAVLGNLGAPGDTGANVAEPVSPADASRNILDNVNDADNANSEWLNAFDEDDRTRSNLTKYTNMKDFLDGHDNLSQLVGKKALQAPGEHSTPEDHIAWRKFIGTPETNTGYTKPTSIQDEAGNDMFDFKNDEITHIHQKMHEHNFTQSQANAAFEIFQHELVRQETDGQLANDQNTITQYNDTVNHLKKDWGSNYEANLNVYKNILDNSGMRESAESLGLQNNESFIKLMVGISDMYRSEGSISGTTNPLTVNQSFDERKQSIRNNENLSKNEKIQKEAELYRNRNLSIGRQDR